MPTYEYRCAACGHEFERFQKMSDPPVRTCPHCKKRKAERLISTGGGLLFKGPGFYATDYRKEPPKSKKEGGGGKPGAGSAGSGSTDSASKDATSGSGSADAGSKTEDA